MKLALQLQGVVKRYGRRAALNGLDLDVPCGALFGLVGSNGAGKTTCMAVSLGLLKHQAGAVRVLDEGPFDPDRHAGRATLLPQDSRLPPHATVEGLLAYYAELQGVAAGERRACVDDVLGWTNLCAQRRAQIRTLSHGMLRRVAVAQAFLGHPELVLLDEPLSGLDPREVIRVRDLIRERRGRQTIVISSHNLHEIEALCDEAAFIEAGRRVHQSAVAGITERHSRIAYQLEPGTTLPPDIANLDPAWTVEWEPQTGQLTVSFAGGAVHTADVNAVVLAALLRANARILEVRCGSRLEQAYMAMTTPPPLPDT